MKEETKSKIIIAVVLIVLIGLIAILGGKKETTTAETPDMILQNAEEESKKVKDSEKKEFTEINVDTYLEYYAGENKQIVLLARPSCHYCQIAEPLIQKISKEYDISINYLNPDNFQEEDESKFINSNEFFKEGYGTPVLLIVSQNQIIDKVDGLTDTEHYIDFFKRNEIIN